MCKTLLSLSRSSCSCSCSSSCAAEALLGHDTKTGWERSQTLEVTACSSPRASLSNTSLVSQLCALWWLQDIIYQLERPPGAIGTARHRCHCTGRIWIRCVLQKSLSALSYKILIDRHCFPLWLSWSASAQVPHVKDTQSIQFHIGRSHYTSLFVRVTCTSPSGTR